MIGQSLLFARKELLTFLVSPFAYVIAGLFFAVNGLGFLLFSTVEQLRGNFDLVTQLYFSWFYFWFLTLFIPPLLTMKLLAEEFRSGTIETLMTAPSTDASVIAGKYLAALAYCVLMWVPTLGFFLVAQANGASFDWGIIAAGYLGWLLIYALFLAVGVFASALTETPILSALIAVVIEMAFFFTMFLKDYVKGSDLAEKISERYSIYPILTESFLKGSIDSMHLVFFVSAVWFFLFLATRTLEFRRWR